MKLFLDDIRSPTDCLSYMSRRIGHRNLVYKEGNWVIVRSYNEFVDYLKKNDLPTLVSFDHDLGEDHYSIDHTPEAWEEYHKVTDREMTGLDAAKYLLEHCAFFSQNLPVILIHSMNGVGCENITRTVESFKRAFGIK